MKIIHTADFHLGRTIGDEKKSRNEEINYALNQILDRVSSGDIDAVLIAGDIFDKAKPSNESLLVFKSFTVELVRLNTPVVAIAGNHDSPSLIDTETQLWRLFGSHIIGTERTAENGGLVRIPTRCGTDLIVGLLPFIRNTKLTNVGEIWSESNGISHSDYSAEMLKKLDELAQGFQPDTVNILMYHGTLEEELKNHSDFEGWLKVIVNLKGIRCPDLNQRVRSICPHAVIVVSEAINQSPQPVGVETEQFDLIQAYRDYLGEQPESRVQKFSQIYQEALALEV